MTNVSTFAGNQLTGQQIHSARVLAALEEDMTGRQPIDPRLWDQLADPTAAEDSENLTHLFLAEDDFLAGDPTSTPSFGYACANLATATAQVTMRPGSFDKVPILIQALQQLGSPFSLWAKGEKSAATATRKRPIRTLLVMTRTLDATTDPPAHPNQGDRVIDQTPAPRIRTFDPDRDIAPWLAINSEIFSDLPDQGNVTEFELRSLLKRSWFDPAGFLVADASENGAQQLVGFHWTKVDPRGRMYGRVSGEVYVLGVTQSRTGSGIAANLLEAGLDQFREQGIGQAHLYVESTNLRAQRFYRAHGFAVVDSDHLLEFGLAR